MTSSCPVASKRIQELQGPSPDHVLLHLSVFRNFGALPPRIMSCRFSAYSGTLPPPPRGGYFYPTLTLIIDFYTLTLAHLCDSLEAIQIFSCRKKNCQHFSGLNKGLVEIISQTLENLNVTLLLSPLTSRTYWLESPKHRSRCGRICTT